MANVRAFRSGNWSDTNPATSPWGTGGVLYAPGASDDVHPSLYTVHIGTNVTVKSFFNIIANRTWKDGATATASLGGGFNVLDGVTVTGDVEDVGNSDVLSVSGINSASFVGTFKGGNSSNNTSAIKNSGSGRVIVSGTISPKGATNVAPVVSNISSGFVVFTGTASGGTGTNALAINNSSVGTIIVTGNVAGGTGSSAFGINNSSTGTAIVVGNVIATSATNAFVSSNANAINKISGNIINHPNGTASIYATRYVVDPIPQNSFIQYSNVNQFSTDSLSAFSMPPVSAVRFGTSFANGTLTGTCKVPSQNSVNVGVPVDNAVGTAFLTPATLFDTSVASLTASNTLGARLKNSATVQSVGNIIASFSN
jgi:hypothetical protein